MATKATPEEIGQSQELHKYLRQFVDRYNTQLLVEPVKDRRYKRTPYDRLKERGLFNSKFLAFEFNKILDGKSELSRAEREAVVAAVLDSAEKAGRDINIQCEKEEAEKTTAEKAPKKPRVAPEKKSDTDPRPARKRSTSAKSAENKPEE